MLPILLLLALQLSSIDGFTEFAGDCGGNGPAVGGLHLNNYGDGSRLVYTGELQDNRISFFVDGTDLTRTYGNRLTVSPGSEQILEIVGEHPFKGALIRMEPADEEALFTLTPMIHAQDAVACVPPILGATHTGNGLKRVLSAAFQADEVGEFTIDITVVDFNNATGSVFWYSQVYVSVVEADVVPAPAPGFSDGTIFPTYTEHCNICAGLGEVRNTETEVIVDGEAASCGQLQDYGFRGIIPPESCREAQVKALEYCGCSSDSTPSTSTTAEPTFFPTYSEPCFVCGSADAFVSNIATEITVDGGTGSCLDIQAEGMNGYIEPEICLDAQIVVQQHCGCVVVEDSNSPPSPNYLPSPYPTYQEICYVCGSEESSVTAPDQIITVDESDGTCSELEWDGANGYLDPSLCAEAQAVAAGQCGCTGVPGTPSAYETFEPTVTPLPTYSETCNLCIAEGWEVTILDAEVTMEGERATCADLQEFVWDRLFPPDLCPEAQQAAIAVCGCAPPTPVSGPAIETLEPTITAYPTTTAVPTYGEICHVCPVGYTVSFDHVEVVVDDLIVTCSVLEEAAMDRLLPAIFCPEAQHVAQQYCGCVEGAIPTFAPTHTPYPTKTFTPTYSTTCFVCGSQDMVVTKPSAVTVIDGLIVSCEELQDAGISNIISPQICPDAVSAAQESCGCEPNAQSAPSPPSSSAVDDPVPSSSTYGEKCEICGETAVVTKPSTFIAIGGLGMTCGAADEDGINGLFSPILCDLAKSAAAESCGCDARVSLGLASGSSRGGKSATARRVVVTVTAFAAILLAVQT